MSIINLGDRIIDDDGNVVYFLNSLIELLYKGESPSELLFPENDVDVKLFNQNAYENFDEESYSLPKSLKTIEERKHKWFYPDFYDTIDLKEYFLALCKNDIEKNRALEELDMFMERDMEKFLRFCIYFSNMINENNWVIGVGRGSSCACFLLYLLKIHLVNPIQYNLNIKEFLK